MSDQGSPSPRRSRSRSPSPRAQDDSKSPRPSDSDKERDAEDRDTSRRSRSRSPAPAQAAAKPDVTNPGNNLYVANLAARVGEQDLQELFSKFGRVDKCEVIVDPVTRESRGFGFVTFEDVRDAEDAVKELNKVGRFELNTPNGSVDTKRPLDNTLDRDLLVLSTVDVTASVEIAAGTEDDGVAVETVADTRVAMMIETEDATTTETEDVAATMTAIVDEEATTATRTTTEDAASCYYATALVHVALD
ncbi:Hypothetical protein PHPALM_18653 [Phytophthora palmivora]|uniref:RRM domain-containing protein n=1 Tax=Phytophthora palmivora TaxID=4796 RepID=A0A2P4XJ59_9STRA|nr:Hypothetical protein PHPALM_18653 [Phytophthora palmivora]